MRITVAQTRLAEAMKSVQALQMPSVLLSTLEGQVQVSCGDGAARFSTRIAATVEKAGRTLILAKPLSDVVQALKGDVQLEQISASRTLIKSDDFEAKIVGGQSFLAMQPVQGQSISLDPRQFKAGLQTIAQVVVDNANLGGVGSVFRLAWKDNDCTFISTDGHRLSRYEATLDASAQAGEILIGPKITRLMNRLSFAGTVKITVSEKTVNVTDGTTTVQFQPAIVKYPPVERVIPASHTWKCIVPQAEVLNAATVAGNFTESITATLSKGELVFKADGMTATATVLAAEGEMPNWRVNLPYFRKALDTKDEQLTILGREGLAPIQLRPNARTLHLVMPMRGDQ